MAKDTKEKILETALEMFSQNGYNGTNIRELTASIGLVKSSVYKHFEDKEAIWNTLLDEGRNLSSKTMQLVGTSSADTSINTDIIMPKKRF